jgi:uncharacterized protein
LKGKESVRRYINSTYIEPPKFEVTQLIAEGDFVTAIGEIDIRDETGKTTHPPTAMSGGFAMASLLN